MKKGLILWARTDCIDDEAERHGAVLDAVQHGFSEIVIRREDARMASSANFIPVFIEGGNVTIDGRRAGRFISIHEADDMPAESEIDGDYLVVETADWKVIPLENLIAQCSSRNVRVIASVASSDEARLFAGTLEKGVDGIMISAASDSLAEVAAIGTESRDMFTLVEAEVISVSPAGMGDRACVDTCSLLEPGEGMLVGSQSSVSFLIHSETLETRYVNSRPFRVNAGPVHSYTALPGGRTAYLSELSAGAEVLAVKTDGTSRRVTVGRVKIERRPLLLIRAVAEGKQCSIILQNAETVCLCSPAGPVPVTSLKKGDRVLVHTAEGGRHFGMGVRETIHER